MTTKSDVARNLLCIEGLTGKTADVEILKGVNLSVKPGEVHAIMGPNGSGKSTLAKTLAGHPEYEVTGGTVEYCGQNLLEMEADERSRAGVFLAFQYPHEIPGVSILNFLRTALNARRDAELPVLEFRKLMFERMDMLGMDRAFATRFVNDGFSGGEKKRNEILQMALLEPKLAILDETDSGLDVDALKIVSQGVNTIRETMKETPGIVIITHYHRILEYIKPDFVHIMSEGRIVSSGDSDLAHEIERRGYDWIVQGEGAPAQGARVDIAGAQAVRV